jgi:hypothetical protein
LLAEDLQLEGVVSVNFAAELALADCLQGLNAEVFAEFSEIHPSLSSEITGHNYDIHHQVVQ